MLRFLKGLKHFFFKHFDNNRVKGLLPDVVKKCMTCKTMRKTPGKPKVALPQQGNVVAKSRKEECIGSGRKVLEDITEENEHKEKSKEQRPKQ